MSRTPCRRGWSREVEYRGERSRGGGPRARGPVGAPRPPLPTAALVPVSPARGRALLLLVRRGGRVLRWLRTPSACAKPGRGAFFPVLLLRMLRGMAYPEGRTCARGLLSVSRPRSKPVAHRICGPNGAGNRAAAMPRGVLGLITARSRWTGGPRTSRASGPKRSLLPHEGESLGCRVLTSLVSLGRRPHRDAAPAHFEASLAALDVVALAHRRFAAPAG